MKKIFQYIMLAVVTIVMAACTSDIENTTATTGKSNVQLVVGEFPAFGDSQTRAIGTPDEGKTSWAEGDELLLEMTSETLGTKYAAFKYNGSNWELASGELSYKEDEVPTFPHVYYAPNYKWEAGKLVLKEGKVAGTDEYIEGKAEITPNGQGINVSFAEATRNYSRLRIATNPAMNQGKPITVTVKKFAPANILDNVNCTYTLTPDAKGNVYLYGLFTYYSTVSVKSGEYSLVDYEFYPGTKDGISYALNAYAIDTQNMTDTEIENVIKEELAAGKTDIKLILAPNANKEVFNAIRKAFNGSTEGTIDLTLIECKEIPANGLNNESGELKALKSIFLPDVTTLDERALYSCDYIETINAPKVTAIAQQAFYGCKKLKKVILGTLTDVRGKANSEDGIFDGINGLTPHIDLYLPESQEIMKGEYDKNINQYIWKPSGEKYLDSDDFFGGEFLGYQFRSVRSWE